MCMTGPNRQGVSPPSPGSAFRGRCECRNAPWETDQIASVPASRRSKPKPVIVIKIAPTNAAKPITILAGYESESKGERSSTPSRNCFLIVLVIAPPDRHLTGVYRQSHPTSTMAPRVADALANSIAYLWECCKDPRIYHIS